MQKKESKNELPKLLFCPFCGGEAKLNERYRAGVANRKMYWVSCKKCGATQPFHNQAGYRKNIGAIGAWNTRKPVDDVVEALENQLKSCEKEWIEQVGSISDRAGARMAAYNYAIEIVKEIMNAGN